MFSLKVSIEKATADRTELKLELWHICSNPENTLLNRKKTKLITIFQQQLAAEKKIYQYQEAIEHIQKDLTIKKAATRKYKTAREEVKWLKAKE